MYPPSALRLIIWHMAARVERGVVTGYPTLILPLSDKETPGDCVICVSSFMIPLNAMKH